MSSLIEDPVKDGIGVPDEEVFVTLKSVGHGREKILPLGGYLFPYFFVETRTNLPI